MSFRSTCQYNTDKAYSDMSSRHLITKGREYLNHINNRKSAIKDQWQQRKSCLKREINFILVIYGLKKCSSEYNAKIHEVLSIKQSKPLLNKHLHANGSPFSQKILVFLFICFAGRLCAA